MTLDELLKKWDDEDGYMADVDSVGEEMVCRLRKLKQDARSAHQNHMAMRASDVLRILDGGS